MEEIFRKIESEAPQTPDPTGSLPKLRQDYAGDTWKSGDHEHAMVLYEDIMKEHPQDYVTGEKNCPTALSRW